MEGRIVGLEPMDILTVKHKGTYFRIGEAFEKLSDFISKNDVDTKNSQWLGIFWDDPESTPEDSAQPQGI